MFSWCSHGNFLYFGLQSFCLNIIFSFCWFYCFDMSTVIGSALLTPPHPPSTPTISCISNLCAKLQNIRASLTAWSSAPTRSTSCFLFYFWQQLFSVPCFKVNFPLRLIRCIAFSCVLTCYSPLVVLHVFIFSLTHCPLLRHPPCLSVSLHRIPWVFHRSYHFLPCLCFFSVNYQH